MNGQHFSDYETYCRKCLHWTKDECEDPCNECLTEPANEYSHKPIRYEPKDSQEKQRQK